MTTDDRPAFYALARGGVRDYWTLLHPPYTVWHLSYVAIGASLAPEFRLDRLLEALAAFFLAMGVAAHALDELNGRPLATAIPDRVLKGLAVVGLVGAVALGVHGAIVSTAWLWIMIPVGVLLVMAYNLELFGGRLHTDLWFALAWGAFPVLVAHVAQSGRLRPSGLLAASGCAVLSAAQRRLSTPVRRLRRGVAAVAGSLTLVDGSVEPLDARALREAPESALRLLSLAVPLLAVALVAARVV